MTSFILLFVVPLVAALAAFGLLRRRGSEPLRAGCLAIVAGVALSLLAAGILTLPAVV